MLAWASEGVTSLACFLYTRPILADSAFCSLALFYLCALPCIFAADNNFAGTAFYNCIMNKSLFSFIIILAIFLTPLISLAEETSRRFKTLSERRDAGQAHRLTPWLLVSPALEIESEVLEYRPENNQHYTLRERSKSIQLDIELIPTQWLQAEIEYAYEDQLDEFELEEAAVEIVMGDFKLGLGRIYVPFGEYYSRFVSGPVLEFAETRGRSAVFSYEPDDQLELALFAFKSKLNKTPEEENNLDWGLAVQFTSEENLSFGVSYLSDLSETDDKLLDDFAAYINKVDAISAYTNIELGSYEVSVEYVQALGRFKELEVDQDKPRAWNIELGIYPGGSFDWALRLEGSRELEEAPRYQAGISMTWYLNKYLLTSANILHGQFRPGFFEDDSGQMINSQNLFSAQMSLSF